MLGLLLVTFFPILSLILPYSAEISSFYILSKSLGAWRGQKISENCGFDELIVFSDPKYSKWGGVPTHFQKKCTNRTTLMYT